jgi:hypothetical protein
MKRQEMAQGRGEVGGNIKNEGTNPITNIESIT